MIHVLADQSSTLEGIFRTFGVHWAYFIAQVVNVILVIIVLKVFAFGPIQQMLEQRKARIAEGEENLKRIEQQLAESEATTAAAIAKANEEAQRLIEEAKAGAEALTEQKAREASTQAQQILAKAEAEAKAERQRVSAELKKEFGRLVAQTTSQVTGKVLSDDDRRRINEDSMAKVEA